MRRHGTHPVGGVSAPGARNGGQRRSSESSLPARIRSRLSGEEGAATAEYAVATMAAVGFAGLLVVILRGDEVRGILTDLIRRALTTAG